MSGETKAPGWREARTSDGETTTFTFRTNTLTRTFLMTAVFAPLPIFAVSMTRACIREGNWGGGDVFVVLFDLFALGAVAIGVLSYSRVRVVIDGTHVEWSDGPFLPSRVRMTLAEAATLELTMRTVGRNTQIAKVSFLRDGTAVRVETVLDPDYARWVLSRIDSEIQRRREL